VNGRDHPLVRELEAREREFTALLEGLDADDRRDGPAGHGDLSGVVPAACMHCGATGDPAEFSAALAADLPRTMFRTCREHSVPSALAAMHWLRSRRNWREGGT